jgi:L-fucose isomerase-like protein
MNNRGIIASCEVDIGNAVMMHALQLATGSPAAVLDWNNNYEDQENKCILFHCGPVPMDMMIGKGRVTDHSMIALAVGEGKAYGPNQGRIKPGPFTFGSLLSRDGRLKAYLGEGSFTDDSIPDDFFGCAGVAEIENLQDVLLHVGRNGHRHHVSVSSGHVIEPVAEALQNYIGFDIAVPQKQG